VNDVEGDSEKLASTSGTHGVDSVPIAKGPKHQPPISYQQIKKNDTDKKP
jgi:hypothetical protein